jgi:hypothetical protein
MTDRQTNPTEFNPLPASKVSRIIIVKMLEETLTAKEQSNNNIENLFAATMDNSSNKNLGIRQYRYPSLKVVNSLKMDIDLKTGHLSLHSDKGQNKEGIVKRLKDYILSVDSLTLFKEVTNLC